MLQEDRNFSPGSLAQPKKTPYQEPPKGLLSQITPATQGSSGAESAFNNILNTATASPVAIPTDPIIGNIGPIQGTNTVAVDPYTGSQQVGAGSTAQDNFNNLLGTTTSFTEQQGQQGTASQDAFNNLLGTTTNFTEQQGQQGGALSTASQDGAGSTASQDALSNLAGATTTFVDPSTTIKPQTQSPTQPATQSPTQTGVDPGTSVRQSGGSSGSLLTPTRVNVQEIASQIEGFYQQYLGRKSDKAGLDYWVNSALNGRSLDQIRADIANSAEGVGRATNIVTQAYQQLLGRNPQQEGLEYWRSGLLQGGTEDALYYNIRQSPEFEDRAAGIINSAFSEFMERAPSQQELSGFLASAKGGTPLNEITAQIQAMAPPEVIDDGSMEPTDPADPVPADPGPADPGPVDPGPAGPPTAPTPDAPDEPSQTSTDQAAEEARQAESQDAEVTGREVTPEQLVQYQLNRILDSNSPLLQSARTRGLQFANQRGLLNSSIAAQASEQAAIDAALQIAQQDAATYAGADAQTVDAMNRAALQDASLGTNVNIVNADSANTAIQGFLNRESQRALQDDAQLFTAEQNQADRELREYLQERQFDFTSTENALDRGLQEALQQNQFAFQSEESKLDRALRTALQESQFEFTGDQNALDRALRQQLQNEQLTWTGNQNELDRVLQDSLTRAQISSNEYIANAKITAQQALQEAQFDFSAGQAALDREFQSAQLSAQQAFQSLEAQKSRDFNAWSQTNQNEWAAAQNDLDREFKRYQVNAQTASAIMYSTMDGIAAVYADPNLTSSQKTQAAANIINQSLQMPGLLTNINERMDPDYVPPEGENPGPGDPGYVPGPGQPGYIPPGYPYFGR